MNATEKMLLIEQARVEFERNVRAALGTEHINVEVNVYTSANMLDNAPIAWPRDSSGDLSWARSTLFGMSVFGYVEVKK